MSEHNPHVLRSRHEASTLAPCETPPRSDYRNHILASLSPASLRALQPHLTRVRLKRGAILFDAGTVATHVYFPEDSVVAMVMPMQAGSSPEVGIVGSEGLTDCAVALGRRTASARGLVLVSGEAKRISSKALHRAIEDCAPLRASIQLYCGLVLAQSLQSAGCHATHSAQMRLARLLLTIQQRLPDGATLPLTQELLAGLLGVQRTTVTQAADTLQKQGLIAFRRGVVTIYDAAGLSEAACECHAASRRYIH